MRCEHAIRAIAPHWRAQASLWGEAEVLFERLLLPATWLCQANQGDIAGIPAALRLLTSSVATAAKAAQLTGISPSDLFAKFSGVLKTGRKSAAVSAASTAESLPDIATILLPRLYPATATLPAGPSKFPAAAKALGFGLHLAEAVNPGGHRQKPSSCTVSAPALRLLSSCHVSALVHQLLTQMVAAKHTPTAAHYQRGGAHIAVGQLSDYGWTLVSEQGRVAAAICGHGGAAAITSAAAGGPWTQDELRILLGRTISLLLGSPLLEFLVGMQHVVLEAWPMAQGWNLPAAAIPPVHLMPASMDPDALDSTMAMQVGGSSRSIHWIYRSRVACASMYWIYLYGIFVHLLATTWITWIQLATCIAHPK